MGDQATADTVAQKFQSWAGGLPETEQAVLAEWWTRTTGDDVTAHTTNWWTTENAWANAWTTTWTE